MRLPFGIKIDRQVRLSYAYLLKWVVLAIIAGVVGSLVVHSFVFLLSHIQELMARIAPRAVLPAPLWALAGALLVGTLIYTIQPHAAGEGIPSYIRGVRIHNGDLLFSVTFFKYWAALLTLSTFGNGGIVGPLGRVSAGVVSFLGRHLPKLRVGFNADDQRTATICGLSAAVGTIFHTSIGGGIFAVEIIQRSRMGYKDLFPAILSSTTAVFVCKAVGWHGFYPIDALDRFMDIGAIGWLILLAVLTGTMGAVYTNFYAWVARTVIKRREGNVLLKVIAGSLVASILAWAINPELLGTSTNFVSALFSGNMDILAGRTSFLGSAGLIFVIMLLCKMACNCITVGSGMSAGFTGPAAIVGMLLGAAVASLVNIDSGSATYHAFIAAGFSGLLASVMNIPLAAAVMTTEIFGLQYSFPAGIAAIVAFQVTRAKTIYDYALAGAGLSLEEEEAMA